MCLWQSFVNICKKRKYRNLLWLPTQCSRRRIGYSRSWMRRPPFSASSYRYILFLHFCLLNIILYNLGPIHFQPQSDKYLYLGNKWQVVVGEECGDVTRLVKGGGGYLETKLRKLITPHSLSSLPTPMEARLMENLKVWV